MTSLQIKLLLALARYRFLTCRQFQLAELGSLSGIRKAIRGLAVLRSPARVVQGHRFPPSARFGKMEHVYSITPYGLNLLCQHVPNVHLPWPLKPVLNLYSLDYFHRWETISFQIRLEKALRLLPKAPFTVALYTNYFQFTGDNRLATSTSLTATTRFELPKGRYFVPDSVFVLRSERKKGLFLAECIMSNKKKRILRQIATHCTALSTGHIPQRFGISRQDFRSLFFFRSEQELHGVLAVLSQRNEFQPFADHIFFASLADTAKNILSCWRKASSPDRWNFLTGQRSGTGQ